VSDRGIHHLRHHGGYGTFHDVIHRARQFIKGTDTCIQLIIVPQRFRVRNVTIRKSDDLGRYVSVTKRQTNIGSDIAAADQAYFHRGHKASTETTLNVVKIRI